MAALCRQGCKKHGSTLILTHRKIRLLTRGKRQCSSHAARERSSLKYSVKELSAYAPLSDTFLGSYSFRHSLYLELSEL